MFVGVSVGFVRNKGIMCRFCVWFHKVIRYTVGGAPSTVQCGIYS